MINATDWIASLKCVITPLIELWHQRQELHYMINAIDWIVKSTQELCDQHQRMNAWSRRQGLKCLINAKNRNLWSTPKIEMYGIVFITKSNSTEATITSGSNCLTWKHERYYDLTREFWKQSWWETYKFCLPWQCHELLFWSKNSTWFSYEYCIGRNSIAQFFIFREYI